MTKAAVTPVEDDMENIGLGCALERFEDLPEVRSLIAELPEIHTDAGLVEARLQRFTTILDYYQEQPHLLDKDLESLLAALFAHLDNFQAHENLVHVTFKYMVMIVKLRGPKSMVRHMPHEVDDMERVLQCLERQNPEDTDCWATRYMLLLWLAILVIIPFNMTSFDDGQREPIAQRIMRVTEVYLHATDKCREVAGLVAARFVTRPDNVQRFLPELIDWTLKTCESDDARLPSLLGALGCLAAVFKHGKRADLLPLAPGVLRRLLASGRLEHANTQIRKLALKSVQRVGLTFLPTRVAAWRYERGQRSLAAGLLQGTPAGDGSAPDGGGGVGQEDESYDVPEEIDEVLEAVLQALRDKDTVVRWSAAKGVGRITNRLPKALADEVLDSLMDIFTLRDNMPAWHGGCLALAELGRRGLLTLSRLPEVIPVLLRALVYDELQGNYSVGAAVRDAACYVCWAFARAYQPDHFRQYALQVAPALLCVALFDREVNCRRAASAAFQENVGRQGTFPHGIEILTTVDYFAVGNRAASFTQLSTFVGQFPEYTKPLISHLLEKKINHWDGAIREVTAKALHNLTPCAVDYTAGYVMDMLRPHCLGIDLNARHGAVLAVAEVVHALSEHARRHGHDATQYIDSATQQFIAGLCDELGRRQMLRGLGGELMRHALCHLIRKASEAELPLRNTPTIASWQALLDDCLTHREEAVRGYAVAALPAFTRAYVTASPSDVTAGPSDGGGDVTDGDATSSAAGDGLLDRYLAEVDSDSQNNRRGFALAVGSLPAKLFAGKLQRVLKHLLVCCASTPQTRLWAECRRDGISAVTDVCLTVGVDASDDGSSHVCAANIEEIYDCLLTGLEDYTSDNRGDVGAWIREAAISGLQRVTLMVTGACPELLSDDMVRRTMTGLSQQAVEKIDRTRSVAGAALSALLHADPPVPRVPDRDALLEILPASVCASINWGSERETLPRLSRLLALPVYRPAVLLGLLVSAGGITERLVQQASEQLQRHLKHLPDEGRAEFVREVAAVMERHRRQDRVTLSVIRALEPLLNCGLLDPLFSDAELGDLLTSQVRAELARCGEPHKLLAGVDLLCALMQFPAAVQRRCLGQLMVLLCHRFPRIRRAAAGGLFETLLTHGELEGVSEEALERAQSLLSDTDWNEAVDAVRPVRDEVCVALGVPVPQRVKK
ncbi:tubulin-specific chaperone D-like [Amphibalanus amphitrite]|uniref:tubulin-specific chaperone D-like n=1 Tax=Amphibalanus amphitrite TaxID=1232801 RepID=UPI001C91BDB1|nr:tubulin-specific chaperone D-like [Amphibalanus amphitrite]XP_043244302.1 tubulin-specific chaperone D-like [Amphibalanus amphitrite]XP_043244303.1 tubulin-specific chaperone D-like [Amphibalanus amphitrite]XP_043244304.1 tubulin-specific chaperone D-like [Amphibalanus amphitrite]XP_043244305.1 tubulin-specific chaperone D-like [Amphibalanus amphitrite]XP_043244306.1 tubulin-specific chaperone D-like [Amphibalanus amphitrite]